MKLFARIVGRRRKTNPTTVYERNRLIRTMPGQTGAMAASRFGYVIS